MSDVIGSRQIHAGSKNLVIQIQGQSEERNFEGGWRKVFHMSELPHKANYLKVDSISFAIADGLEVQVAWSNCESIDPLCPLMGRGKLDWNDVGGAQCFMDKNLEEIVISVAGEAKNDLPCFLIIMDMSLHQGAL